VRGQRHAPAAFYARQSPGIHFIGGWVGPRAGMDGCGKSRPNQNSIPGPSNKSLYRLSYCGPPYLYFTECIPPEILGLFCCFLCFSFYHAVRYQAGLLVLFDLWSLLLSLSLSPLRTVFTSTYLKKKPRHHSTQCCSRSVYTFCAKCNVISPLKYVSYWYISTSRSLCALANMAVCCISLISCFRGTLLRYCLEWFWNCSTRPCYYR
jgi:hypothetical protein